MKSSNLPVIANVDRRKTIKSMSALLAAALGPLLAPAMARADTVIGHVDKRRRFVADFSRRFRMEFETEAMKRPDGDFKPGRAPAWLHEWMDILWDRLIRAHFPGPTAPR